MIISNYEIEKLVKYCKIFLKQKCTYAIRRVRQMSIINKLKTLDIEYVIKDNYIEFTLGGLTYKIPLNE